MTLKDLLDFVNQGWVGVLIAIVLGVPVAYYLHVRAIRGEKPKLVYQVRGIPLISNNLRQRLPSGVTVEYRGEPVQQLTRTQFAVWNAGGGTLEGSALVESLRWFFANGGQILEAEVVAITNAGNNIELKVDAEHSVLFLTFDFLDPAQGGLVEVLHTSKFLTPFGVSGTIRGVPDGLELWGSLRPKGRIDSGPLVIMGGGFGIALIIGIVASAINGSLTLELILPFLVSYFLVLGVATLTAVWPVLPRRRTPPRELMPDPES